MTDDKPRLIDLNDPTSNIYKERIKNQNTYIENRLKTIKNKIIESNIKMLGTKEEMASFLNLGIAQNLVLAFFKFEEKNKESECLICNKKKSEVRQLERAHCNKFARYDLLMMAINKLYIDVHTPLNSKDILIEFIRCHNICPIYYLCNKCHKEYDTQYKGN